MYTYPLLSHIHCKHTCTHTEIYTHRCTHTACILYVCYTQCVRMKLLNSRGSIFLPQKLWPDRDYTIFMGKPYTWLDTNTTQSPLFWRALRCWGWITEQPRIEGTEGWALSVSFHPILETDKKRKVVGISLCNQTKLYQNIGVPSGTPLRRLRTRHGKI